MDKTLHGLTRQKSVPHADRETSGENDPLQETNLIRSRFLWFIGAWLRRIPFYYLAYAGFEYFQATQLSEMTRWDFVIAATVAELSAESTWHLFRSWWVLKEANGVRAEQ